MKKLSIVIITLNEERYLGNLLNDLASQIRLEPDQKIIQDVIISDGGSADGTSEVALAFKPQIPLIFHTASRRGYGRQKNEGARLGGSEALVFLDADIRIGPSDINTIWKTLQANPDKIIVSFIAADSDKLPYKAGARLVDTYFKLLTLSGRPAASGQCFAMSRKVFESIGGYDESIPHGEDLDLLLRARRKGIGIAYAKGTSIKASTRRFEKEGTIRLMLRYARSELHRLFNHGKIKRDYIGYDKH